jgi:DNA-binding MarR family transcriptional regulator
MATSQSLPAMLRRLRALYRDRVRDALDAAGYEDVPEHGPAALGIVARAPVAARDLAVMLGLSKQSASQLIDILVMRGYAERHEDPDDRRRLRLLPTPRGLAAARLARSAVAAADASLRVRVGADAFRAFAATLAILSAPETDDDRAH